MRPRGGEDEPPSLRAPQTGSSPGWTPLLSLVRGDSRLFRLPREPREKRTALGTSQDNPGLCVMKPSIFFCSENVYRSWQGRVCYSTPCLQEKSLVNPALLLGKGDWSKQSGTQESEEQETRGSSPWQSSQLLAQLRVNPRTHAFASTAITHSSDPGHHHRFW